MNCFVVQPTCAPANDNLMELLIMIDALKRASAGPITAVIPYYGYARQDRKVKPRTPITAQLVADLITAAGVDRVLAIDLHAGQIQGFFNIPVDHLFAMPVLMDDLRSCASTARRSSSRPTRAAWSARAPTRSASARASPSSTSAARAPNVSEVMNIIGDVKGRTPSSSTTWSTPPARCRRRAGGHGRRARARRRLRHPRRALAAGGRAHHGLAARGGAWSPTRSRCGPRSKACPKIKVLSVARLLGEAIKRIHHGDSISSLFI